MSISTRDSVGEAVGDVVSDAVCEGILEQLCELCPLFAPLLFVVVAGRFAVGRVWRRAGPAEQIVNEQPRGIR